MVDGLSRLPEGPLHAGCRACAHVSLRPSRGNRARNHRWIEKASGAISLPVLFRTGALPCIGMRDYVHHMFTSIVKCLRAARCCKKGDGDGGQIA